MRIALLTPRAHHKVLEFEGEEIPGILVEGKPIITKEGMTISNLFLPVLECHLVRYTSPTANSDEFCIATQIGIFRNAEGGLYLGPNNDHNDKVLCFIEFRDCDSVVIPKYNSPEFVKRVEFEEGANDIFLMILKQNVRSSIYVFDIQDTIIEHEFFYDYIGGHVEHRWKKVPDEP